MCQRLILQNLSFTKLVCIYLTTVYLDILKQIFHNHSDFLCTKMCIRDRISRDMVNPLISPTGKHKLQILQYITLKRADGLSGHDEVFSVKPFHSPHYICLLYTSIPAIRAIAAAPVLSIQVLTFRIRPAKEPFQPV